MAMQAILDTTSGFAQVPRLSEEITMPPLKAFMDDTTVAVRINEYARSMLYRSDELLKWSRMSFQPKKPRRLSILKGRAVAISFSLPDKMISVVFEEPVKGLIRVYDPSLTDKTAAHLNRETTENGILIDRSRLVGMICCLQFMLILKMLWPLLIYDNQ